MSIALSVKNACRIVPIRFERAVKTEPSIQFPDIDNRGFRHSISNIDGYAQNRAKPSNAVTIASGQAVTIKLVRETIAPTAPIYITSSNEDVLTILTPAEHAKCDDGPSCFVSFKATTLADGAPKSTTLEARFSSIDGPIIHRLTVYVLPSLIVKVQPYLVAINGQNGASGKSPALPLEHSLSIAQAIWSHVGISLSFAKPISLSASLLQANKMACNKHLNEMNELTSIKWQSQCINLYICEELEGAFSYTINAQEYKFANLHHPAIFFGLRHNSNNASKVRSDDAHACGNALAHELGHFFSLQHPQISNTNSISLDSHTDNNNDNNERQDTWSMRSLMFDNTLINRTPPTKANWSHFNDFGYGIKDAKNAYRGALIPIKSLDGSGADSCCAQARNYIATGHKHLYS
jgi:hypothetical protein